MGEDLRDFAGDYRRNGETTDPYLQNFLCRFADKIEAEFQKLRQKIEKNSIAVGEHFKKQGERIEALEFKVRELEECRKNQQNWLRNLATDIRKLEKKIVALEQKSFEHLVVDHNQEVKFIPKDPLPTDKDEPQFKVGDTIAFCDDNATISPLRIVLDAKRDFMKLMYVPSGVTYTTCSIENYRLIYRPKFPEPKDVQGKLDALEAVFDIFSEFSLEGKKAFKEAIKSKEWYPLIRGTNHEKVGCRKGAGSSCPSTGKERKG